MDRRIALKFRAEMGHSEKYKYRFRPSIGSNLLLLEFLNAESDHFCSELLQALRDLHPKIDRSENLPMDEFLYHVSSDCGPFTLSLDMWGIAFILSEDSGQCLMAIDRLLRNNGRFERVEADPLNYKRTDQR
jgi:hypothetical protein